MRGGLCVERGLAAGILQKKEAHFAVVIDPDEMARGLDGRGGARVQDERRQRRTWRKAARSRRWRRHSLKNHAPMTGPSMSTR